MKRGEIKQRIVQLLDEKGPMTIRDLMEEMDEPWNAVFSSIKSLSNDGKIYAIDKNHKCRYVWAVN